jgi:alpha-tubulin suppressor-like RCC1 family protein
MPRPGSLAAGLVIGAIAFACGGEPSEPRALAASIVVTPESTSLLLFDTLQLVATARDANGAAISGKSFSWRLEGSPADTTGLVSAILVDSVGSSSRITAIYFDQTNYVIASADGVEGRATVTTRANLASFVRIKPDSLTMVPGGSVVVLAAFRDANDKGTPVSRATWGSSNPSVAHMEDAETGTDLEGNVVTTLRATAAGSTDITLTSGSVTGTLPVRVTPGVRFSDVVVNGFYSCALTTAGAPWCWGESDFLGAGLQSFREAGSPSSALPLAVLGGHVFSSIATGDGGTCGLTAAGAAFCWGFIGAGVLYDSAGIEQPVPAGSGESFTTLAVGGVFICGLHAGGSASCWGDGSSGALGDGGAPRLQTTPVPVAGGLTFSSISASGAHVCGLTGTGAGYCWGSNVGGPLGNGDSTAAAVFSPTPIAGGLTFASIVAGVDRTCALTPAGKAYCWGKTFVNEPETPTDNQCLTGRLDSIRFYSRCHTRPVEVTGGLAFTQIGVGDAVACGLTAAGTAYCWGAAYWNPEALGVPTPLPDGIPFATVSIGNALHACGRGKDGFVYCFGSNSYLESGVPDGTETVAPVRVIGQQ